MGIIINNSDVESQSDIKKRITAELREKQTKKSLVDGDLMVPEYKVEEAEYMKDLKPTTSLAWAWALVFISIVGILIAVLVITF